MLPTTGDTFLHIALRKLNKFKARPTDPVRARELDLCVLVIEQLLLNLSPVFLQNRKGESAYDLMQNNPVTWTLKKGIAEISRETDTIPNYIYKDDVVPRDKYILDHYSDNTNRVAKGLLDDEIVAPEFVVSHEYTLPHFKFASNAVSALELADQNGHHDFFRQQVLAHAFIADPIQVSTVSNKALLQERMAMNVDQLLGKWWFADSAYTNTECAYMFSLKKEMLRSILKRCKTQSAQEVTDLINTLTGLLKRDSDAYRTVTFIEKFDSSNFSIYSATEILITKVLAEFKPKISAHSWKASQQSRQALIVDELSTVQVNALNQLAEHVGLSAHYFYQGEQLEEIANHISAEVAQQTAEGLSIDEYFPDIEVLTPEGNIVLLSTLITDNTALVFQPGAGHKDQWKDRDAALAKWKLISHPDAADNSVGCAAGCTGQIDNYIKAHAAYKAVFLNPLIIMSNKTAEQLADIKKTKNPPFIICSLTPQSRERLEELGILGFEFENQRYLYRDTYLIEKDRKVLAHFDRSKNLAPVNANEMDETLKGFQAIQGVKNIQRILNQI